MNALDLLNENEKRICAQMLMGLSLSEVADICSCTTNEVNNIRLKIIAKFEQSVPYKIPEPRHFKFIAGN